jgi:hypothetical protein
MKNRLNILLIVCLLFAVASVGVYSYIYKKLNEFKQDVVSSNLKIETEERNLSDLEKSEKNLKTITAQGERLSLLYIEHENIVDFIQMIESIIKTNKLVGQVVSVSEVASQELEYVNKEKLLLAINARGEWADIYKLVGLLEKLPFKSSVDSVSLINSKPDKAVLNVVDKTQTIQKKGWEVNIKMYAWAKKTKSKTSTPVK